VIDGQIGLHVKTADAEGQASTWVLPASPPAGASSPPNISPRKFGANFIAVRRKLYEGGLSVRTSLDTKLQLLARKTFTEGL
jgi:hypothetical protein